MMAIGLSTINIVISCLVIAGLAMIQGELHYSIYISNYDKLKDLQLVACPVRLKYMCVYLYLLFNFKVNIWDIYLGWASAFNFVSRTDVP